MLFLQRGMMFQFSPMPEDVEFVLLIAMDRIYQLAFYVIIYSFVFLPGAPDQRDKPKQECWGDDEPCELHPVRQGLVGIKKILPEIIVFHLCAPASVSKKTATGGKSSGSRGVSKPQYDGRNDL